MRRRHTRHLAGPTALPPRQRLRHVEFAVLDTETSGWDPEHDHILQVAVVVCTGDGRVVEEFSSLVRPPNGYVGPTSIHGLTFEDILDAPPFELVLPELARILRGRIRVAHNLAFDAGMLAAAMARAGYEPGPVADLDTLTLSAGVNGTRRGHGLKALCDRYDIPLTGWHDAHADAAATAALLPHLLRDRGLRRVHDLVDAIPSTCARADWPRPRLAAGVVARVAAQLGEPADLLRRRADDAAVAARERAAAAAAARASRVRFRRTDERWWVVGPPDAVRRGLVVVDTRRGATVVEVLDTIPLPDEAEVSQVAGVVRPVPLLHDTERGWEVHGPAGDVRPGTVTAVRDDASTVVVEVGEVVTAGQRDGLAMVRGPVLGGLPGTHRATMA